MMDPENTNESAPASETAELNSTEANTGSTAAGTAPKADEPKTPESDDSSEKVEVSENIRKKYGDWEPEKLLSEIERILGHSRKHESTARETKTSLTTMEQQLAELQKANESATKELAEIKAEKARIEVESKRSQALLAAGLDPEEFSEFIHGEDDTTIKKQVEKLAKIKGAGGAPVEAPRAKNVIPTAGTATERKDDGDLAARIKALRGY